MAGVTRRDFVFASLAGIPALALAGCASGGSKETEPAAEAPASQVSVPAGFEKGADARVVALSKSVGDLWLLAGGKLVGITEDGLDLDGIGDATSVGTLTEPNQEQIVALEPDVVMLTADIPAHVELKPALDDLGIATYVADVNSFEDYQSIMDGLLAATGRDDLRQTNVDDVATKVDQVRQQAKEAAEGKDDGTYLALRVSSAKNKVLKSDYFACEILDDMQLSNVADDTSALDDLSIEAIVAADPTWVFVVPQGQNDKAMAAYQESFESKPAWSSLTAVAENRVAVLPKDLFQYKPNARWGEAYEYAYGVVFGGQ